MLVVDYSFECPRSLIVVLFFPSVSQRYAREADHHVVIWIIDLIRFHLVYPINDGHRPSMAVSTLAARMRGVRAGFVVPGASRCPLAGNDRGRVLISEVGNLPITRMRLAAFTTNG